MTEFENPFNGNTTIDPVLDTVYFRSGNDFYRKQTENVEDEISVSDIDQYVIVFSTEDGDTGYRYEHIISRLDGPAIIEPAFGLERWVYNGMRHRVDGPAEVKTPTSRDLNTRQEYFVFDLSLTEEEFRQHADFIRKAHNYVVENNLAFDEADSLPTEEKVVLSFRSKEDFFEAAKRGELKISYGTTETKTEKWVSLGMKLGLKLGLTATALLGGLALLSRGNQTSIAKSAVKTRRANKQEPVSVKR